MSKDLLVQGYDRGDDISAPDDFEELFGSQVRCRPLTQVTTRAGGARGAHRDISVDGADSDVLEIETAG